MSCCCPDTPPPKRKPENSTQEPVITKQPRKQRSPSPDADKRRNGSASDNRDRSPTKERRRERDDRASPEKNRDRRRDDDRRQRSASPSDVRLDDRRQQQRSKSDSSKKSGSAGSADPRVMAELEKVLARLEKVTARLEGVAAAGGGGAAGAAAQDGRLLQEAVRVCEDLEHKLGSGKERERYGRRLHDVRTRLRDLEKRLAQGARPGAGSAGGADGVVAPFVLAFDDLVNGAFADFIRLSNQIGGDVQKQATFVQSGFAAQRDFLVKASKAQQPSSQTVLVELLKPTSDQITSTQEFREKNRGSPFFNHLSTVSESIPALGWVTVTPTPGPHVKEMSDAGQFYSNRVLKDWKEKDKVHADWVKAWFSTLRELQGYIKAHHTTGLTWNRQVTLTNETS